VFGSVEQLVARAVLDDPAGPQDRHLVADVPDDGYGQGAECDGSTCRRGLLGAWNCTGLIMMRQCFDF
jgi:hypothetical protein